MIEKRPCPNCGCRRYWTKPDRPDIDGMKCGWCGATSSAREGGRKVYIAGPMRGILEFNFPAFYAAEKRLQMEGYEVLNPARMDAELDGLDVKDHDGSETGIRPITHYVERDVRAILSLGMDGAVAVLPGWESSTGARAEVAVAHWLKLTVIDAETLRPIPYGNGDPRFHGLLHQMGALHDKKQEDYGSRSDPFANVRASQEWGIPPWIGALVRLNDKVHRLKRFAQKGSLANESAEDSMMDIAVYALIALVLYREASQPAAA